MAFINILCNKVRIHRCIPHNYLLICQIFLSHLSNELLLIIDFLVHQDDPSLFLASVGVCLNENGVRIGRG